MRAELQLVERPKIEHKRLALAHFDTLRAALEATPRILELEPAAIELMDKFLAGQDARRRRLPRPV